MKTFATLLGEYVSYRETSGTAPNRLKMVRHFLGRFVRWLEANRVTVPLEFEMSAPAEWHRHLTAQRHRKTGVPLKPHTVFMAVATTRGFCDWLIARGYLPETVMDGFPSLRNGPFSVLPAPTHEQVRAFLRSVPCSTPNSAMMRALAEFLYSSGCRICEALGLNIEDINFEHGLARVLGKGRKERMVPFGRIAKRHLENYLTGIRPLILRDPANHAVWLNHDGRRLSYSSLQKRWVSWTAEMQEPIIKRHALRRACATELVRSGANVWLLKELLGHEDLSTLKHYVDLRFRDLKRTHERCHPRDRVTPTPDGAAPVDETAAWAAAEILKRAEIWRRRS